MDYGLATADYIVLAGFFVVMLAVGLFYANRMHSLRDFFGGGRQVPWWLSGISLYMTTFSAFTFVSYSALAFQFGFVAVTIWWISIPGCLLSAWFLAGRWRRAATTSPVEYLETRFSPFLRQVFSWFGIPLIVLDDALKLFVIGGMVATSMGATGDHALLWAIGGSGLLMLVYTMLGGLWAVLITDFVQFIVMGTAVIVLVPLAWREAGGYETIMALAPENAFSMTAGDFTWPWLLSFAVILALVFATKWPYVQRYYAARSHKEARRVGYLVAALTFLAPPLLFFPAFASRVFIGIQVPPNEVYATLCVALLPVGMLGILLAAMFSATMSMLSSDYNAVASVVTNDIVKRLFLPNAGDRALVFTARTATLFVGLAAMGLAMLFAEADTFEDLVQYMARLFAGFLPPVGLPMIAGLLSRRVSDGGARLGFFLGASCGLAAFAGSYMEGFEYLLSVPYLTWITLVPTVVGIVLGTAAVPNSPEQRAHVDAFLEGLTQSRPEPVDLTAGDGAKLALRVIGVAVALLGLVLIVAVATTAGLKLGGFSMLVGTWLMAGGGVAVWASYRLKRGVEA